MVSKDHFSAVIREKCKIPFCIDDFVNCTACKQIYAWPARTNKSWFSVPEQASAIPVFSHGQFCHDQRSVADSGHYRISSTGFQREWHSCLELNADEWRAALPRLSPVTCGVTMAN
ncbi:hypothetical protein AVEN_85230-1 [Araneus ventricosus]|uniref:Uncharacterized protein n=1 Tax=Araneus ventricosus TaxID=182803 RepID=A0A4Y2EBX4_ARAVE|nr:hypothetical protein AVEN_85230-1 [Araneus ventricosus]